MSRLRFTTLVEAPLTVAFDVARALGRPWPVPLEEVVSVRPARDVYAVGPGRGWRWLVTSRACCRSLRIDWRKRDGMPCAAAMRSQVSAPGAAAASSTAARTA